MSAEDLVDEVLGGASPADVLDELDKTSEEIPNWSEIESFLAKELKVKKVKKWAPNTFLVYTVTKKRPMQLSVAKKFMRKLASRIERIDQIVKVAVEMEDPHDTNPPFTRWVFAIKRQKSE